MQNARPAWDGAHLRFVGKNLLKRLTTRVWLGNTPLEAVCS